MKANFLKKVAAICCAVAITATAAGCGAKVEETSTWVEGEGTTQTITHSSGSKGTSATQGTSDIVSTTGTSSVGKFENTNVDDISGTGGSDKKMDLGGRKVTIGIWGATTGKPGTSSSTYKEQTKLISDIEKKYNCKIAWKGIVDSMAYQSAWVTAAQAGTKFCDIGQFATSWVMHSHFKQGYFTKLDDYLDVKEAIFNQSARKQMEYKGGNYVVVMSNRWYIPHMLYFNRSIFSKFGVDTPDKYVARNEWTVDNFIKVAKACTQKSGGTQYYGMNGISGSNVATFIGIMGGKTIVERNGKKYYDPDKTAIEAVQLCHDLRYTYGVAGGSFNGGTTAMEVGGASWHAANKMEALGASNVGATWLPKKDANSKHTATVTESTSWGIPSTAKNPEVLAQILRDYNYPYKWRSSLEENCQVVAGDATSIKTAIEMTKYANNNLNLSPLYPYISRKIGWGDYGLDSKTSPQAFFAKHKAAAQAELDSFWGQK